MIKVHSYFSSQLAVGVLALALGACTSTVDQSAAFQGLRGTVGDRVSQDMSWRRDAATDADVAAKVKALADKELTLESATQIALLNNRGLQARYAEIGIANADLVAAGLLSNPILDVMVRPTTNPGEAANLEFALTQSLLDIFMRPARKKVAQAEFTQIQSDVAQSVVETVNEVRAAYVASVGARNAQAVVKEVQAAAEASHELAQRFHIAGNISDLQLAEEAAMAEDVAAMADEMNLASIEATESLAALLNLDSGALTLPVRLPAIPDHDPDNDNAEKQALERRLDMMAARKTVAAKLEHLKLKTDWRLWQEIELTASAEREGDKQWAIGPTLAITLPLFNQGGPDVARAAAELLKAENELQDMEAHVRADVKKAHAKLETARRIADRYRNTILPLKQDIVRLKQEKYNFMLIGVFDVLVAKRDETAAYLSYVNVVRDYWLARANLAKAMGGAPLETADVAEGATP